MKAKEKWKLNYEHWMNMSICMSEVWKLKWNDHESDIFSCKMVSLFDETGATCFRQIRKSLLKTEKSDSWNTAIHIPSRRVILPRRWPPGEAVAAMQADVAASQSRLTFTSLLFRYVEHD
jgi:hypothetical protein